MILDMPTFSFHFAGQKPEAICDDTGIAAAARALKS
jgi:hypothetical protein